MGRPDKSIVGADQFGSCGAIDELLSSVPSSACESVLRELNEAPVDFREYCECSDYTYGPNFCSLCGGDSLIDEAANQSQLLLGGYTCGEYFDLAGSAQTLEYCDTLRMGQPVCCKERRDPGSACHVCESGADMQVPSRRITLLADNVTCETYDRELEAYAEHPYCDGLPGFNFASYCHCDGAKAPKSCDFCSGAEVANPDLAVFVDGLDVWLTCEDLAMASLHVSNDHLCSLLNIHSYACCGVDVPAYEETTSCHLCPTDSPMTLPDRPLVARFDVEGTLFTCSTFDQYLRSQPAETCRSVLEEESLDLASYCGCGDSSSVSKVCQPMCGEGKVLADPERQIPLNEANVTCGQADLLNSYFTDERLCAGNFPVLQATCCIDATASNGFGTQAREYKKYQQHMDEWIKDRIGNPFPSNEEPSSALHDAYEYGLKETASASEESRASKALLSWGVMLAMWVAQLCTAVILLRQ